MVMDLLGFPKMDDQTAIQEATSQGCCSNLAPTPLLRRATFLIHRAWLLTSQSLMLLLRTLRLQNSITPRIASVCHRARHSCRRRSPETKARACERSCFQQESESRFQWTHSYVECENHRHSVPDFAVEDRYQIEYYGFRLCADG